MKTFVKIAASVFFLGHIPWAAGTLGSLVGILIAWFFNASLPVWILILSFLGFLVCKSSEEVYNRKDPQTFILDEVCGMMLAVLWLPQEAYLYVIAFILFRIFDIAKPWPIIFFQRMKSPLGIMWDDLVAGALVNVILQIGVSVISLSRGA